MTAPAAMPSVDQIIPLIQEAMSRDNYALALHTARKIDALFARILAEKERQLRKLAEDWDAYGVEQEMRMLDWRDRALAAEAALAGERERCAKIADAEAGRQPNSQFYTHQELGAAHAARRIAAAIRAEGV